VQGVVSEDGAYVLGVRGFLTEEEMHETLKVIWLFLLQFTCLKHYLVGYGGLGTPDKPSLEPLFP